MSTEVFIGCCAACFAGGVCNIAISNFRRRCRDIKKARHPLFVVIAGTETCSYLMALLNQLCIYPSCILAWMALGGSSESLTDKGLLGNANPSYFALRVLLYAFVGHLVRDLPGSVTQPLIVAHHIASLLIVFVGLLLPASGVVFVMGVFTLELGSICYGLWMIDETMRDLPMWCPWWPRGGRFAMGVLYRGGMTVSNVIAFPLMLLTIQGCWSKGHWAFGMFHGVGGTVFLLARQREVFVGIKPPSGVEHDVKFS
mmetsp:Transcript_47830/g.126598  ORF Transcript_47830/g.126598 Transcript_47830/m.126598 type:complete len:256 (-) Transcript_47830:127-894(-)